MESSTNAPAGPWQAASLLRSTWLHGMILGLCAILTVHRAAAQTAPIPAFSVSDTIYVNSPVTFINNSTNAVTAYWDVIGLPATRTACIGATCYMSNSLNFRVSFPQTGTYQVKLYVVNAFGNAQLTKNVVVYNPSSAPQADFELPKQNFFITEVINFIDMSTKGASSWKWSINPPCYTCFGRNAFSDDQAQNPSMFLIEGGDYSVCLDATNSIGTTRKCKNITVQEPVRVCNGNSVDTVSYASTGYLSDPAGAGQNYIGSQIQNCAWPFYVIPCADTLYLEVLELSLANGDTVFIRNGASRDSSMLIKLYRQNIPTQPIKAFKGGIMIQFKTGNTNDAGFLIRWSSSARSFGKASPDFVVPDTVYHGYSTALQNTSTGTRMSFKWDTNQDGFYGNENLSAFDSISKSPVITFQNPLAIPIVKQYCLKVTNCVGDTVKCKLVTIMPIIGPPFVDFSADRRTGFTEDVFRLKDKSVNGAKQWQWTFTPATVTFVNGTSASSQHPVVLFNAPGYYRIRLQVQNIYGATGTLTRDSFIHVLNYDVPSSVYPLTNYTNDVGIEGVQFNTINSTTALKTPEYHDMYSTQRTTLYRGGTYTLKVSRSTAATPMNRKAWIDFNQDARFDGAGELVIDENGSATSKSTTVTISRTANIGTLRLRVGASMLSSTLSPSGTNIGCYEDYGIVIGEDNIPPTIELKGDSVMDVEVHKPFSDPWAKALDNIEGDISSSIVPLGNVDTSQTGFQTIGYYAEDAYGNRSPVIYRLVRVVVNRTGPTLALNGTDTMRLEVKNMYHDPGFRALDNTGANINSNVKVSGTVDYNHTGIYVVNYEVTDAFGLKASAQRTVIVQDTTRPALAIKGSLPYYPLQLNTAYTDGVTASDNYDLHPVISHTGTIRTDVAGTYTLLYTARDSSGNVSNGLYVDVKVDDFIPPTVSLNGPADMTVEVKSAVLFSSIDPWITYSDNITQTEYISVVVSGSVDMNVVKKEGYELTYTVTDLAHNVTVVKRKVRVVDTTPPVIVLNQPSPYNLLRFGTYNEPGVTIHDNYDRDEALQPLLVKTNNIVNHKPGSYAVTYNVTDLSGNAAQTVTRLVTVLQESTGIDEAGDNDKLRIYPNPSKGVLNIDPGEAQVRSMTVYNSIGTLVKQLSGEAGVRQYQLDLSEEPAGIYFIRVETANGMQHHTINIAR